MFSTSRNQEDVIFNQNNISNFNRNKLFKEKLQFLDFNYLNIIRTSLILFQKLTVSIYEFG